MQGENTTDDTRLHHLPGGQGRVGIGQTFGEGLNMGRHGKAPVRCPCSRLTALRGAPRTQHCGSYSAGC